MEPIIKARKDPNVERVFAFVNRWMLKRYFHQIWTIGFEKLKELDPKRPVIFYANHSNWWDGLIAFYLTRDLLKIDGYLMMMAKQLRKYSFFRWIGAFSVDRDSPISAYRSLEYIADLLNDKTKQPRALWIFPQGELLANDFRPIKFLRGLDWLIKHLPEAQLVAVTFKYEFLNEQLPEVFLSFSNISNTSNINNTFMLSDQETLKTLTKKLEEDLTKQLDRLKLEVIEQKTTSYRPILKGGMSINIMYERAKKLLGL
ncbi:MAG: lysophospholipid acyltransferase family protein [Acidobacteria bacterium]|nr:lysophospholipid acyltransferase family protein [Acidobacteriota bacterium]